MFKKLASMAALACATLPALAADQIVDLSSGEASFIGSAPVLDGGDDVISFVNLAAGTYDFLLSVSARNITGLTASINGQAAAITVDGRFSFAGLESTGAAPFNLTITGLAGSRAAYSGEMAVTAVPEPQTWALMLAGMAAVGALARRRSAAGQA